MSAPTRWPWRVSSSASVRVDFVVHRSGDIGSPRSSGSTRASNAGRSPGSRSATRLRPPPGRRTRPNGSAPASSSSTPADTVASRTPAARATSRIPPCPSDRASAPITSRRCRSSRCGKIAPNFAVSVSRLTTNPIAVHPARFGEPTGYLSAGPNFAALRQETRGRRAGSPDARTCPASSNALQGPGLSVANLAPRDSLRGDLSPTSHEFESQTNVLRLSHSERTAVCPGQPRGCVQERSLRLGIWTA